MYFSLCGVLFHFSLPLLVHLICLLVYLFYTWFIFPLSPVFFSNMIFFDRFVFAFLSFTSVFFSCLLTFPDSSLCYITFLVLAFDLSSYFYRFIFYKVLHVYRVYKGRAFKKKRLNCFLPSSDLLLFFLSPFPIVTGKTEIVRGSICLNVFSVSSGQIYSIHIPENRRENNVQIEVFFFLFSFMSSSFVMYKYLCIPHGGTSWLTTRRFWV